MFGLETAEGVAHRLRAAQPRALRQNCIDPRGIVFGCGHVFPTLNSPTRRSKPGGADLTFAIHHRKWLVNMAATAGGCE